MLSSYETNPILSKLSDNAKILSPLNIPFNASFGNLYTQSNGEKNYSWKKALLGQEPLYHNKQFRLATDPFNFVGLGVLRGMGVKTTGQFIKNAISPLRGAVIDAIKGEWKLLKAKAGNLTNDAMKGANILPDSP